ncbi:MAG: hypothetical protein PWP61_38 [Trichococcus sp.]|jgi:hypothetical protein|nr:hypothetical protein [Trichococcus sp.]
MAHRFNIKYNKEKYIHFFVCGIGYIQQLFRLRTESQ